MHSYKAKEKEINGLKNDLYTLISEHESDNL